MSGWKTAQGGPQEGRLQGPPQRAQGRSPGAGPHLAQTARPRAEGTLFLQTLAAACDLPPRGHPEQLWTRAPARTSRAGRPGPDTPPWASNGSNATALSLSLSCLGEATVAQETPSRVTSDTPHRSSSEPLRDPLRSAFGLTTPLKCTS